VADPVLPPSKFVAGYTVGAPPTAAPIATTATRLPSTGPLGTGGTARQHGSYQSSPMQAGVHTVAAAPAGEVNRLAVTSFAVALFFGWFAAPVTMPLAYVARNQIRRSGQGGAALAKAALVISFIYLTLAITVFILWSYVVSAPPGAPV
jgi:hypothetical protein